MRLLPTMTLLTAAAALCGAAWLSASGADSRSTLTHSVEPALLHSDHSHRQVSTSGRPLAPLKPMSVLAFVEPKRYLLHSGETVRVSLTLVASETAHRVMVAAQSEAGAEIVSKPQYFLGDLSAGQEATVWFDVTVLAEGKHYVSVVAQADTPDGVRLSSYAVPVETHAGDVQAKSAPTPEGVFDSDGNRLRLLPASRPQRDQAAQ